MNEKKFLECKLIILSKESNLEFSLFRRHTLKPDQEKELSEVKQIF
jgi:hypothetical protein